MSVINGESEGYAEIAGDAFGTIVDAIEARNARRIEYVRTVWGIFARPFSSTALDVVLSENAIRTSALVSVSLDAAGENNRAAADFAREAGRFLANVNESYVNSLRGVAETTVSNLNFVKNAAARMQSQELQVPHFN